MRSLALICLLAMARTPDVYTVDLTTSGGITGKGVGAVSVKSSGTARVTLLGGQTCEAMRAPPALLQALNAAIRGAEPAAWKDRYLDPKNPDGCCDQVFTRLTLERGGSWRTAWFDGSRELAPPDARAIADGARAIYDALAPSCKPARAPVP